MSGVLHPVGPEPPQVYWVRRVVVIAAAVLALVLVIAVVANLNNAASATGPEAVPAVAASTSSSTSAESSDGSAASATPSAGPSHDASSAPSNAAPTLSVMSSSTAAPKESASAGLPTKPSASSSATGSAPTGDSKSAAKSPATSSAKSGAKASAVVAGCDPAQLRQTLTGTQRVTAKSRTTLDLSLINGGPATCQLRLTPDDFVVTIYSGKDRIWSTADCADLVKPTTVKIASQGAYEWQIVWNGLRSKKSCQSRPEVPRPGTYVATAQFTGATPVHLRMFLKK